MLNINAYKNVMDDDHILIDIAFETFQTHWHVLIHRFCV